jgi:hypothetical protein
MSARCGMQVRIDFEERFTCPGCGAGREHARLSYVVLASHPILPLNDRPDEVLVGWEHETGTPDARVHRPNLQCGLCGESWPVPSDVMVFAMRNGRKERRLWPLDDG